MRLLVPARYWAHPSGFFSNLLEFALPERRVRRQRGHDRQPRTQPVEHGDTFLVRGHRHMHVLPTGQLLPRDQAERASHLLVALVARRRRQLRQRTGRQRDHLRVAGTGCHRQLGAQPAYLAGQIPQG